MFVSIRRLTLQLIISLFICNNGLLIEGFNLSFLNIETFREFEITTFLGYIVSLLWLTGLTNAFNWVDGMGGWHLVLVY